MSMENAILAHAAALSELAAAVRALVDSTMGAVVTGGERIKGTMANTAAEAADKTETPEKSIKGTKVKDTGKTEAGNEKAAEETTTAAASDAGAGSSDTGADDDGEVLDYLKDVKPRLLAVVKKVGKEKVSALIQTYGVAKAEAVDPAQFADLLEKAEALEK